MEQRSLGNTGLTVSSLCLGAMTFGEPDETSFMHGLGSPEDTSCAIIDRALDAGINFIDTADVYGHDGLSERVIGRWFEKTGRRDDVVLATKFRFRMKKGANGSGASRYRVIKSCEDSLRRLKTDYIDLYQIHMQDMDTPEEETLRALDDLVRAGKVRYLGCSNYAAYRLAGSLHTSDAKGLARFATLQAQYSLIVRDLEREHIPLCRAYGLGLLPWSPLAGGFLTGKYKSGNEPPAGSRLAKWSDSFKKYDTPRNWKTLVTVETIARERSVGGHKATSAQVALAWLLKKQTVTSVIFGARTMAQLEDNLGATKLELTDAQMHALDEASGFDLGYPYEFMQRVQKRW